LHAETQKRCPNSGGQRLEDAIFHFELFCLVNRDRPAMLARCLQ
jgi:hypothetical protein